ncbi:hypothetical protein HNQ85_000573 [Anoxybacillus calidus]|uniref:Probable membrane transporter protein n=1 Tax=[Anoxybacillus] calidus TaxID=575178 RepID=A0A7V9YXR6_9BACL|nr:sulfite exporter TauE/SafE family protein [Anoxybacillus calidus]MBA2870315.1 hypothetical protein [Anoxybacillus calidus]
METSFFLLTLIGILSSFVGTLADGAGLITLPAMMLVGIPIQAGIATNWSKDYVKYKGKKMNAIALVLLLFALFVSLQNKQWVSSVENKKKKSGIISKILSFSIAIYDGGFGPGSSTFAVLHYMSQQYTYVKAAQLTRVFIFGSCLGAFIVYYQTGFVEWHYALAMAIGSAVGSQIGLLALPRIPLRVAKSMLVSILFLLIGQILYKLI